MERRRRILVIDDDVTLGNMLRRVLSAEHDVVVLTSAADAFGLLGRDERFDLVLCDLLLPGMTGDELYERMASIAPRLTRRFVFMTGGACSTRTAAFLQRTTAPHIEKPFPSVATLRALVRGWLHAAERGPSA